MKKYLLSLISASLLSISLMPVSNAVPVTKGGRAVIFSQEDPKILDPLFNNSESAKSVYNLIYSGLVAVNDNFEYYPDLAVVVPTVENKGVVYTNEGMIVTYKLKDFTYWQDGTPLTPSDIKFTWQCYTNPNIQKQKVEELEGYQKITKIESPDDKTVKIYFSEKYADYNKLFRYILPKHGFVPRQLLPIDEKHPFNTKPIGSGPFKIVDWKEGNRLILDSNPKYFGTKSHVDQIVYQYGEINKNVLSDFEKGKIHLIQATSTDNIAALKSKNYTNKNIPLLDLEQLSLNTKSSFLSDVNVRRAIACLANRDKISSKFDNLKPTLSDLHPNSFLYDSRIQDPFIYNQTKATYLLGLSGWKVASKGTRVNADNKILKLNLITTNTPLHVEIANDLSENLKQIDVALEVKYLSEDDIEKVVRSESAYDILLHKTNISTNGQDRLEKFGSMNVPPQGKNYSRYTTTELDTILNSPSMINDVEAERVISKNLKEEVPIVPLFMYVKNVAYASNLGNFRPNPLDGNTWNSTEWWLN